MFDSVTLAAYRAASTPTAKAEAVRDSLGSGTLYASIRDGEVEQYAGSFLGPLTASNGVLSADTELAGLYPDAATPDDASWTLRIRNADGSRWVEGTFGGGGRFQVSRDLAKGQALRLDIAITPIGYSVPISGSFSVTDTNDSASVSGLVTDTVAALDASAVPSPIVIYQNGQFDFADHVTGGVAPYYVTVGSGSLPSGVTWATDTALQATSNATVALSGDIVFDIDDSAAVASLPTFGVTSAVGGTDLPFTFGHVFAQGDVPAGSYVDANLTDWQVVPTTTWPDGSLRHAIISGLATCTAGVRRDIQLIVSQTARTGTALTETDLLAALPATTLAAVGHQTITLADLVGTPHRTVCTGPVMSNWIYRSPLSGSTTLVAWFDVRLYADNRVEVFPWLENGYLTGDTPATTSLAMTFTMGGTVRFSQTVAVAYRTRIPLLNSTHTTFAHWSSDPQITPKHDGAYLRASKMVPNYGWTSPSEGTLNGLIQTYTPNTLAGVSSAMGAAGGSASLLPLASALYCTTGDARAYRAAVVFGLSGGSWSVHLRDSDFGHEPFAFTNRPTVSEQSGSPATPAGTGATNGTPVTTHQPSYGYLPWLVTGRWWFLDESLLWTNWNYWKANTDQRRGLSYGQNQTLYPAYAASAAAGIYDSTNGTYVPRGAAWSLRTLAQSLAITPSGHPCHASLKASWEANCGFYHAMYVTGTYDRGNGEPSRAGSALGFMGEYGNPYGNATYWAGAGWMYGMVNQVWGFTKDLDLPQTTGATHDAVVAHAMKWSIGCAGDATGWNYRRFTTYAAVIGNGTTFALHPDFATALAGQEAFYSIGSLDASAGLSLKQHSSNTDLTGGDSSRPYFGQQLASLAYATEFGLPGASAAWARVTGASNYATVSASFNNDPVYGIVPRSA